MKIYRCVHRKELALLLAADREKLLEFIESRKIDRNVGRGFNTFDYSDGKTKIHFYLYAESALACLKDHKENMHEFALMQYEVPYSKIKDMRGFGYYSDIFRGYNIPIPEFALPTKYYAFGNITGLKEKSCLSWYTGSYRKYLHNLPRQVMSQNGFMSSEFIPGYDKFTIMRAPFEEFCGVKDINNPKPKVKTIAKKVIALQKSL
jgi:hypothetical protein